MKFIGFDREDEAIIWAKEKMGIEGPVGFCRAMSIVDDNNRFALVVVMSNFSPRNIDMHQSMVNQGKGFGPKVIVEMFNRLFHYAFDELKAVRVTGLVKSKNTLARRFDEHLGFKLEGIMKQAFEDDDLCIYGFLKDDFLNHRWHDGKQRKFN